jgi:hypothetical protein
VLAPLLGVAFLDRGVGVANLRAVEALGLGILIVPRWRL